MMPIVFFIVFQSFTGKGILIDIQSYQLLGMGIVRILGDFRIQHYYSVPYFKSTVICSFLLLCKTIIQDRTTIYNDNNNEMLFME